MSKNMISDRDILKKLTLLQKTIYDNSKLRLPILDEVIQGLHDRKGKKKSFREIEVILSLFDDNPVFVKLSKVKRGNAFFIRKALYMRGKKKAKCEYLVTKERAVE